MVAVTVEWEGETYKFDPWKPSLNQMRQVKEYTGLNWLAFMREMAQLDPACIVATYWLMVTTDGTAADIETVKIADPVGYMLAVTDATNLADQAESEGNPAGVEKSTPSSTPTPGDSETPTSSSLPAPVT